MNFFDCRSGLQIGKFNQQVRLGMPHYRIHIGGRHYATIKMKFSMLKPKFKIHLVSGGYILITGDWIGYDFQFTRNGRVIAVVSKAFYTLTDTYGVEVVPGEDVVLMLISTVIIDKCLHENQNNGNNLIGNTITNSLVNNILF